MFFNIFLFCLKRYSETLTEPKIVTNESKQSVFGITILFRTKENKKQDQCKQSPKFPLLKRLSVNMDEVQPWSGMPSIFLFLFFFCFLFLFCIFLMEVMVFFGPIFESKQNWHHIHLKILQRNAWNVFHHP